MKTHNILLWLLTFCLYVTTSSAQQLTVFINAPYMLCKGQSITLMANVTGATGNCTYSWSASPFDISLPWGNSYMPFVTVKPVNFSQYSVTVTDGAGKTGKASTFFNVSDPPIASAGNDTTIMKGDSAILQASGGYTYKWSTGEQKASTVVKPDTTTTYTVTVWNTAGCSDTTRVTVSVNTITALFPGYDTKSTVLLHPDADGHILYITGLAGKSGQIRYSVFDLTGRCVVDGLINLENNNQPLSIDISRLNQGMYLLKLTIGGIPGRSLKFFK